MEPLPSRQTRREGQAGGAAEVRRRKGVERRCRGEGCTTVLRSGNTSGLCSLCHARRVEWWAEAAREGSRNALTVQRRKLGKAGRGREVATAEAVQRHGPSGHARGAGGPSSRVPAAPPPARPAPLPQKPGKRAARAARAGGLERLPAASAVERLQAAHLGRPWRAAPGAGPEPRRKGAGSGEGGRRGTE